MKTKIKLLAMLLAVLMLIPLTACKDDETLDSPPANEDFSGFISGNGTQTAPPSPTEPALKEGDENATVIITSYEDLKNKLTQKGIFVLENDITINSDDFLPLGDYVTPFLGTFDGNGHKITLTTSKTRESSGIVATSKYFYSGLFAVTKDATIKNLTLEANISATSTDNFAFVLAGGIAGAMINTSVEECSVSGSITAKSEFFNAYVGGICATLNSGKIEKCSVSASLEVLESQNRAVCGGITAYASNSPIVNNCVYTSSVKATAKIGVAYAGGLVAHTKSAKFTACEINASVNATVSEFSSENPTHGTAYAGGIVALAAGDSADKRAEFTRCYALQNDVIAIGNDNSAYSAGICARVDYANFKHCYSLCNVTLETGLKEAFAASGFASINSTGEEKDNVYYPDFSVDGCFALGNVSVTHNKRHYVFYGTFYAYTIAQKGSNGFKSCYYSSDATYKINNNTTLTLKENGTKKEAEFFTLDNCINDMGWASEDWQSVDGVLKAK